jgi:hypothetical protein
MTWPRSAHSEHGRALADRHRLPSTMASRLIQLLAGGGGGVLRSVTLLMGGTDEAVSDKARNTCLDGDPHRRIPYLLRAEKVGRTSLRTSLVSWSQPELCRADDKAGFRNISEDGAPGEATRACGRASSRNPHTVRGDRLDGRIRRSPDVLSRVPALHRHLTASFSRVERKIPLVSLSARGYPSCTTPPNNGGMMRRTIFGLAATVLSLSAPLFAAAPRDPHVVLRPEGAEAAAIYNVMITLPESDRKVVFRGLSAAAKAAVWRAHLDEFSTQHVLTRAQIGIINAVRTLLTEDLFALRQTDGDWESQVHVPLQRIEQSARSLFPQDLLVDAFSQLGPAEVGNVAAASLKSVTTASELGRHLTPSPQLVSECTCSEASDMCWFGNSCGGGICWFNDSDWGCGFGWAYHCDSTCRKNG